jgi:ribosomal protein L24E
MANKCVIDITACRFKKGTLQYGAGTLLVIGKGKCFFSIRKKNSTSFFYELRVRGAGKITQITNFEKMCQFDWTDRSMIEWIGKHGPGLLDIAKGVT